MINLEQLPNLTARRPVQPGEPAPDFCLPALHCEGTVSLADYLGKRPVFLAIMRGLYCPFCRRHLSSLGGTSQKLNELGVDVLGVVATPPHRAKTYLKFRPAPVPLAADPLFAIHDAFGLPKHAGTEDVHKTIQSTPINPWGELPKPAPLQELGKLLSSSDPYEWTDADQEAYDREEVRRTGQFLVDRDGVVRWAKLEGFGQGPGGLGTFPSTDEILAAARSLAN